MQKLLRENKSLSCKNIAEKLGIPQTKAEHWFRVDSGFAIPDREIWLEIKELLGITDNSFDAQIMDFEIIDNNYDMGNRTYDMNGLSPTITSASTPLIKKEQIESEKGYAVAEIGDGVYINRPHQKRGCVQKDCIQTIKTSCNDIGVVVPNQAVSDYRIRKLTPKECWRLMGFSDTDFDKAKESGVSNCQLYKQAGNSIVVNVLMAIFKQLIWEE